MSRNIRAFKDGRTRNTISSLYEAQGGRCFFCGQRISMDKKDGEYPFRTFDHFIPLARGGQNRLSNVVLACSPCNQTKGSRFPTVKEKQTWNYLARILPHFTPFADPTAPSQILCLRCGDPIGQAKLDEAGRSGNSTESCSRRCARVLRNQRRSRRKAEERLNLGSDSAKTSQLSVSQERAAGSSWPTPTSEDLTAANHFEISGFGHILKLRDLRRLLAFVSHDKHQWTIHFDQSDNIAHCTRVDIVYSNPEYADLPSQIIERFSIIHSATPLQPNNEDDTYVCLHPDTSHCVQGGLYIEDGLVKGDFIHDLDVFWAPLLKAMKEMVLRDEPTTTYF